MLAIYEFIGVNIMGCHSGAGGGAAATTPISRFGKNGAEQTTQYKFTSIIGTWRSTGMSELDKANSIAEVRDIEKRMKSIIQNDSTLDQQGKITFNSSTDRRVNEAVARVSPVSNRKEMTAFISSIVRTLR